MPAKTWPSCQDVKTFTRILNILDLVTLIAIVVFFFSALVRSAFGFGETLIAVPLLALVIPVQVAAPVGILISMTMAAIIIVQDWQHVQFRSVIVLLLATCIGIPAGLWLLHAVDEQIVKTVMAFFIMAFSVYCLLQRRPKMMTGRWLGWFFGFWSGVLGGAYGMNGPPLVVFGSLQRWSPQRFRATLQGYFFPASLLIMAGYWSTGLWTAQVTRFYLLSLPGTLLAVVLGRAINRRMRDDAFIRYVHYFLIAIAGVLLLQTWWLQ